MNKFMLIICCIMCFTCTALAQKNEELGPLLENLHKTVLEFPQEKVYLHLDKPNYLTGEDIWMKGYITLGTQNQLSALSQVLHMDLVGPDNGIIAKLQFPIFHGVSMGDFHIPDSLREGTYQIIAYTNWMRNFPDNFFFKRAITIGHSTPTDLLSENNFDYNQQLKQLNANIVLKQKNGTPLSNTALTYVLQFPDKIRSAGQAKTDDKGRLRITFNNSKGSVLKTGLLTLKVNSPGKTVISKDIRVNVQQLFNKVQFLPEGGRLVTGLQSRIAFKILQPDGLGADGAGYIEDEAGTSVATFSTEFAGMGSFFLKPEPGKTYKAVIKYKDGKTEKVDLPEVATSGFVTTVYQRPSFLYLTIGTSADLVKNQKMTILVQRQGKVLYAGEKIITTVESLSKLPTAGYPSGILQITLFDEALKPVCERLFFNVNPSGFLQGLVSTDKQLYGKRDPVTVSVTVGAGSDSLKVGTFSVAVVNPAALPPVNTNNANILSTLLLTSELKGYVEQPDHYFEQPDKPKNGELDNLMLCQGWRRVVWDDIKAGKLPVITYQPQKGFTVSGTITKPNGTPVPNAKVSLLSTDAWSSIDTVTNSQGRFIFDRLLLRDSSKFAIQARDANGKKNVDIKLDPDNSLQKFDALEVLPYPVSDSLYQQFVQTNYEKLPDSVKRKASAIALKEVKITAERNYNKVTHSSNLNGPGNADQVFIAEDLKNSQNLVQFLNGRAMGVRFDGDTPYSTRVGLAGPQAIPMTVIVDGTSMQTSDATLANINVQDVESIEILRKISSTFLYGGSNGVIIITTKTGAGGYRTARATPENISFTTTGFNAIREFYAPDYLVTNPAKTQPDHRAAIFWKPDVITDKDGKASFKFYTSDDNGTYNLILEGMTADGRLLYIKKAIQVEN